MGEKIELEQFLSTQLYAITKNAPGILRDAMVDAVFSNGGRVRPKLVLLIAKVLGAREENATLAAASAVELIHCASLVHDDMMCFDNADMRRGKPSIHRAYGERIALLVGDGLIAASFEVLATNAALHPEFASIIKVLSQATGASDGLVSGQAWEDQPDIAVETVHKRKTGALFEASTRIAALIAEADEREWKRLGQLLGLAYQVSDDLLDAAGTVEDGGKPVRQDKKLETASAVKSRGLSQTVARFHALVEEMVSSIPTCDDKDNIEFMVRNIADRLFPAALVAKGATRLSRGNNSSSDERF